MKASFLKLVAFYIVVGLYPTLVHSYVTVGESGEITPEALYKIGIEPQFVTSGDNGINLRVFFDGSYDESKSYRFHLGTGATDFVAGGSFKWIPIPDYESQPAMGGKIGASVVRISDATSIVFQFTPLISKKYEVENGTLIPYAGLPLLLSTYKGESTSSALLALGTEFKHIDAANYTFGAEIGMNAKDAFSYFSFFGTIYFDEERGLLVE